MFDWSFLRSKRSCQGLWDTPDKHILNKKETNKEKVKIVSIPYLEGFNGLVLTLWHALECE